MLRHFERAGKPKPGMALTAAVVPVFAGLQLYALLAKPLAQPAWALILYIAGGALFWSAIAATRGRKLAACFQPRIPPAVVRTGPYRAIRHPFYTAYTLVWIGGFAATGWWPLGVTAVFMAGLYAVAARFEELAFLRSSLAAEYRCYMRSVGGLLPRIRKA